MDKDGLALVTGVWDNWYEASAEDGDGNGYTIDWKILEDYNASEDVKD